MQVGRPNFGAASHGVLLIDDEGEVDGALPAGLGGTACISELSSSLGAANAPAHVAGAVVGELGGGGGGWGGGFALALAFASGGGRAVGRRRSGGRHWEREVVGRE